MLQVARLAPKLLGESADLVQGFLRRQQNDDGGFKDRTGCSDLYYTVFGLEGLLALQAELPVARVEQYLRTFADGAGLDSSRERSVSAAANQTGGKNPYLGQ